MQSMISYKRIWKLLKSKINISSSHFYKHQQQVLNGFYKKQKSIYFLNIWVWNQKHNKFMTSSDFVSKLSKMLKGNHSTIQWNEEGTQFHILNFNDFRTNVLPTYFRHDRYDSFVRQLNMYGFHKISRRKTELIFHHEHFIRGKEENYHLVKRKTKNEKQGITHPSALNKLDEQLNFLRTVEPNFTELFQRLLQFKQKTHSNNKMLKSKLDQVLKTVSTKKNKVIKPVISEIKEYISQMDTSYRSISELINENYSQKQEKSAEKLHNRFCTYSPSNRQKTQEKEEEGKVKQKEQNKYESFGKASNSQLDLYLFPDLNPSIKSISRYID